MKGNQTSVADVRPRTRPDFGADGDQAASEKREALSPCSFETRTVDPTCDREWDALVASHPEASIFHSAAWAKVLRDTYAHKPIYLCFSRLGKPAALFPIMEVDSSFTGRRGVALPFSDVCEPLFFGNLKMKSIAPDLCTLARNQAWKYLEVRGEPESDSNQKSVPTFLGHSLPLDEGVENLRVGCTSAVRRNLAKAERAGLKFQISREKKALAEFYVLHVRTRRRHGAPPQPFRFFENIYRHLIEPGLGFVALVGRDSEPIAAAVFLGWGQNAVYKFGASDERFQQHRANNLVMWEAIKHLCESGAQRLQFGRTSPGEDGLRRFKLGWGAKEEPIRYARLDPATGTWASCGPDSSPLSRHVFRHLPLAVNRWTGSLLYPHLD